jgi:predicted DNA-binding WGR domain protein
MTILNEMTLAYVNRSQNSQKYYISQLVKLDDGKYIVKGLYGRMQNPIADVSKKNRKTHVCYEYNFDTEAQAKRKYFSLTISKQEKGYQETLQTSEA